MSEAIANSSIVHLHFSYEVMSFPAARIPVPVFRPPSHGSCAQVVGLRYCAIMHALYPLVVCCPMTGSLSYHEEEWLYADIDYRLR